MNDLMNWIKSVMTSAKIPAWLKITFSILMAIIIAVTIIATASACSTIRVIGNEGSTTATVRQSALDSMEVNIKFNPLSSSK